MALLIPEAGMTGPPSGGSELGSLDTSVFSLARSGVQTHNSLLDTVLNTYDHCTLSTIRFDYLHPHSI